MDSEWHIYIKNVDGHAESVFVDTAAGERCRTKLADVIVLHLRAQQLRDNGFPSQEDFERVYAMEEDLARKLDGRKARYVGRVTRGRDFSCYFYTNEPDINVDRIEAGGRTTGLFAGIEHRADRNWDVYRNRLYPSDEDWQQIHDLDLLAHLQAEGDDPSKPRPVEHWMYFPERDSRDRVGECLVEYGFDIVEKSDPRESCQQYGLHVCRVDSIRPNEITGLTVSLQRLAKEYGGEYDGWETPLVR